MARTFEAAVDLGTGYVRVVSRAGARMVEQQSVVAAHEASSLRPPFGPCALMAPAPVPDCESAVRPLAGGVIVDIDAAGRLLAVTLRRARGFAVRKPGVLACIPSDASAQETDALRVALDRAGAGRATIVPEPLAAAIGAGLDVTLPYAQLVVDVGDGVTDAAVIRDGSVDLTRTARIGCAHLRDIIANQVAAARGRAISADEAQRILDIVGLARGSGVEGATIAGGAPGPAELRTALEPAFDAIAGVVRGIWQELTDEDGCEVVEGGICLAGGGARLDALAEHLRAATGLHVNAADCPFHAVIRGASRMAGFW